MSDFICPEGAVTISFGTHTRTPVALEEERIVAFETHGCEPLKKIICVVTIDAADSYLFKYTWRITDRRYVTRSTTVGGRTKKFYLHREILGVTDRSLSVDHIDGNPLNNTRNNLRICTAAENSRNCRARANGASKYKGVNFQKSKNKWRAAIMVNGKHVHLGYFHSEFDAAAAYNEACIRLFGEFARPNVLADDA